MKLYQTFPHLAALALFNTATAAPLNLVKDEEAETISISIGLLRPIIMQHAREDHRPYLHYRGPDGNGVLTECSPGHHKPTGYIGDLQANGRDYFHNPSGGYWRQVDSKMLVDSEEAVQWEAVYHLLDESGWRCLRIANLDSSRYGRTLSHGPSIP